ncbi:MAG: MBL fold metallo-hydrolase [Clostridia bacterium]|nr:MBL fold metallo-hydrolase [Clostridia bacterium]
MARFCSLFSSSSGNATFVGSASGGVLIDAGVSAKRIRTALTDRSIDPKSIRAILVTHEHSDHISGLRVLASGLGVPVYATPGTLDALAESDVLNGKFPVHALERGGDVTVGDLLVHAFETPHDSSESCGFVITLPDEQKVAIATDIGHVTNEIMRNLLGCSLVMLESNHDVGMLQNGPYPYFLKRRILSDVGHLSNEACADVAVQLVEHGTTRLFLGHLSAENNIPALAYQTSLAALQEAGAAADRDFLLTVNPKENLDDIVRF